MTETRCSYRGDREQTLMAYLYDDITPIERSMFESHLAGCVRCSEELDELRGVRTQLTEWRPPKPAFAFSTSTRRERAAWTALREIPAWAQVAAAMLLIGVSAGIANLHVHYGSDGLTVRTGWSDVARGFSRASGADAQLKLGARTVADATPWRSDLTALEQRLRGEMRSSMAAAPAATPARDDEIIRRVRDMIAASERRQERELALGVANVVRDVNASRAGDLARIEHTLGALQTTTGAELMKQRQQMVNYLTQVSLRR
jgi:Putative zinc-finger